MGKKDRRVDAYIAKSADVAKPILTHLRETFHAACPALEEKIKWGFPHFDYMRPRGGMQPLLTDDQVKAVGAYVYSLTHK